MDEPAESLGLPRQILWRLMRHLAVADGDFPIATRTVGEVLTLYRSGEINQVSGLGRTRLKAVRDALERVGLSPE
jgi:hypothetical protein